MRRTSDVAETAAEMIQDFAKVCQDQGHTDTAKAWRLLRDLHVVLTGKPVLYEQC